MERAFIEHIYNSIIRIKNEIDKLIVEIEARIEPDVDPDYEADTAISEETAAEDIKVQDEERIRAYNAENAAVTLDEIRAKATEASHA